MLFEQFDKSRPLHYPDPAPGGLPDSNLPPRPNRYPTTFQHDLFAVDRIEVKGRKPLKPDAQTALRAMIENGNFTDGQREFITHVNGPMLVLAGAGSGKTFSVAQRVLHLASIGVPLDAILALTFTKKAAGEMKDRFRKYLSPYTSKLPHVKTMHSLGLKIIKRNAEALRYNNGVEVIPTIYADSFLQRGLEALPSVVRSSIDGDQIRSLAETISRWKNAGIDPLSARHTLKHPLAPAYVTYQTWLQETGYVDFDDLIRLPTALFTKTLEGQEALRYWQNKFRFIMVDEYQDTNRAQEDLLCLLAQRHRNICVVGDDNQSIYGWRGAVVENILEFPDRWQGCVVGKLEENFRSTPNICATANRLIAKGLKAPQQKELRATKNPGKDPVAWVYPDQHSQAAGIAQYIIDSGRPPGDFAIIVRDQYRAGPDLIEEALANLEIPYEVWFSDNLKMGPTKRNAYSLLGAAHDPRKHEPSFLQLFRGPTFELGEKDYEKLLHLRSSRHTTIWDVMSSDDLKPISKSGRETVARLKDLVDDMHTRARRTARSESLAQIAFDGFRVLYPGATNPESWNNPKTIMTDTIALRTIVKNIDAYEPKAKPRNRNFSSFLQFQLVEIPRRINEGQTRRKANEERKKVTILTMHGSKGLEFPVVFLPSFVEGVIPHEIAIRDDEEMSENGYVGDDGLTKTPPLDEELRLAFVSATRAQEELIVTVPEFVLRDGRQLQAEPSRFLPHMGIVAEYKEVA